MSCNQHTEKNVGHLLVRKQCGMLYHTENWVQSKKLEKAFLFPNFWVWKRPTTNAFLFPILKVAFQCDHEKPRGDGAYVVLLVPPVLPPEDLAESCFSIQHREKDHSVCCDLPCTHLTIKTHCCFSRACCQTPKWPQEQSLSPECFNHVVFNHCDP